MTRINSYTTVPTLLVCLVLGLVLAAIGVPEKTSAQQVSWNDTISKTLYYAWTDGFDSRSLIGGWSPGLQNPNVTVKYYIRVIDVTNGYARLNDGDKVEVGTQIRFKFMPHADTHIYWFGTGFSDDSPYGHWRQISDQYRPDDQSCLSQDYLGTFPSYWDNAGRWDAFDVYVPLNIKEPEHGFGFGFASNRTTAGLTKINDDTWEVTSPGVISARFIWRKTTGKFFYRYKANWNDPDIKMSSGLCVANNYAMREAGMTDVEDFVVTVPQQDLYFTLNAVMDSGSGNRNPNPPIVWGPDNFVLGELYTYKFRATDPDGDDVRYFVDFWPLYDETEPAGPDNLVYNARRPRNTDDPRRVPTGTMQSIDKSWGSQHVSPDGRIRFEVFARDGKGGESRRTRYVIKPVPPLDVTCVGAPDEIQEGQSVRWSASINSGTTPYMYRWSDGSFSSSEVAPERTYNSTGNKGMYLEVEDEKGNKGSVDCSEVRVVAAEPDGWIWADEYNLTKGESTLVNWDSTNADYCEVRENGVEPARWPNETSWTDKDTGPLSGNTTYELYCSNGSSLPTKMDDIAITVRPQCSDGVDNADPEDVLVDMADPGCDNVNDNDEDDPVIPTMTADLSAPSSVPYGQPAAITWYNITNADSCTVSSAETGDNWSSISNPTNRTSANLTSNATFNLQCQSSFATPSVINRSVMVSVAGTPTCTPLELNVSSDFIVLGDSVTLTWNIAGCDVSQCTISGSGISGSESIQSLTERVVTPTGSATYTLDCGPGGIATTTVEVEQSGQES